MFRIVLALLLMCFSLLGFAQEDSLKEKEKSRFFIAYELGEAVFNSFQSVSGEIGVRFKNHHLFRVTHMNVGLTEQHLSSSFGGAVDGDHVKGKMFGFEAFYDFPILLNRLYVGPSVGYYKNEYTHTILDEKVKNNTATIGAGISYRETNMFRVKGLYTTLSIPIRVSLNAHEDIKLGETTINNNRFDNNIWFFIGFEF